MANQGLPNPLAAPLTTMKQLGEQANISIQSLGTGLARSASQGLDAIIMGTPALPALPGAAPGQAALPTPASLMPANLQQALSNIENVLIPPGLPRPSQAMGGTAPTPTPTPTPPAAPASTPRAVSGMRRISELRGV